MTHRELTNEEIHYLERQGCICDDWSLINVAPDFDASKVRNVRFDGEIEIGAGCQLENIGIIRTTEDATFGEGTIVSVMNEASGENVIMFSGLTSQLASMMVRYSDDKEFTTVLRAMVYEHINNTRPRCTKIGNNVVISGCRELTNVAIGNDCEIYGAARLVECTLNSTTDAGIFIGDGVICDNVIMQGGASITDGARLYDTFVGEACHVGRGFTSENSIFFANSYMDNGEACAAFCGPFTVSHHKSTLLIGGMYSFYNAGSGTNYSNHAYKIGPIHYGTMHRGAKTASGAHILWPAQIGCFSMAMGKIQNHPDTTKLPFSYIISQGDTTTIVPGRNLLTVGTFRDIYKWPKRDARPQNARKSHVNFDWLSPIVINACMEGREFLNETIQIQGRNTPTYAIDAGMIRNHSAMNGIHYYDLAIKMYIYESLKDAQALLPTTSIGTGEWIDLSGMLAPKSEIDTLIDSIKDNQYDDILAIEDRLSDIHDMYENYRWAYTYALVTKYFGIDSLDEQDIERIRKECSTAKDEWLLAIRKDAEKEYQLGDLSPETLNDFIKTIK